MKTHLFTGGLMVFSLLSCATADDHPCDSNNPCVEGCCSSTVNLCGYGPDYCGKNCIAKASHQGSCAQKSECDPGYFPGYGTVWGTTYANQTTCPLNVCCSEYGFCGTTSDFCGTTSVTEPSCGGTSSAKRTVGYYEGFSQNRACDVMYPEQIPIGGYTHVNFAFIYIDPNTYKLTPMAENQVDLYSRTTALKQQNSKLQVWFSIGGWDFNDPGATATTFSKLAASTAAQAAFFESVNEYMTTYGFDGIDIDWEYPVTSDRNGSPEDYENYVTLLQNLRRYLSSKGSYGLSITIPSSYWYMKNFDIVNISKTIDWFNIMTYDLHGTWDSDADHVGKVVYAHTNLTEIKQSMDLLWRNDIDPSMVNLGLGFYGRSFTLSDSSCKEPGCPFSGGGTAGPCTGTSGVLSYTEIEDVLNDATLGAVMTLDPVAAVQIVTWSGDQWVSFDNEETFAKKREFANSQCLGGTMVWAVSQDVDGAAIGALQNVPTTDLYPDGDNNGTGDVYIDGSLWTSATQGVSCSPPCTLVLPPYPLGSTTTLTWPDYTTEIASSSDGTVYTKTTTIEIPDFSITAVPFWAVTVAPADTQSATFSPEQSITPPAVTLTLAGTENTWPVQSTSYPASVTAPTTATATTTAAVTTPAAVQTGIVSDCNDFYFSTDKDNCASIAEAYGISVTQFIDWNPAVGSQCTNFWLGEYYCVGVSSGKPVSTPAAVQSGVVSDCTEFYFSTDKDGCQSVADAHDISVSQLEQWNPALGSGCTNFWISEYYCVAVATMTSGSSMGQRTRTKIPVFFSTSHVITIRPQATHVSISTLPPSPVTYHPRETSSSCKIGCGTHHCDLFGCGGACGLFACDGGCGLGFCGGGCGLGGCGPGCGAGKCTPGTGGCSGDCGGGGGGGGDDDGNDDEDGETCDPDLSSEFGLCDNNDFPLYNPGTGKIECSPQAEAKLLMSACQAQAGDDTTKTDDMIDAAKQCCPSPSKRSIFDRLFRRSSPACPNPPANPPPNDPNVCTSTYTCRGNDFPNICANARSAIEARGYSNRMVRQRMSAHNTNSFWQNKPGSNSPGRNANAPRTGWALQGCNVEEYPFASGRVSGSNNVLRLVPEAENSAHANDFGDFYNAWDLAAGDSALPDPDRMENGRTRNIGAGFCIEFDNDVYDQSTTWGLSLTGSANPNICGVPYGNAFLLVGGPPSNSLVWDPYFAGTNLRTYTATFPGDRTRVSILPPQYCKNPSPGFKALVNGQWSTQNGAGQQIGVAAPPPALGGFCEDVPTSNLGRRSTERARGRKKKTPAEHDDLEVHVLDHIMAPKNAWEAIDEERGRTALEPLPDSARETNSSTKRVHGELTRRDTSSGSYLDGAIYKYLGGACASNDDYDPCYWNDCPGYYDDDNGDSNTQTATASANTGQTVSTKVSQTTSAKSGQGTTTPPPTTKASPLPTSFIDCTHHNQDPGEGVTKAYCVCSGSTFAEQFADNVTPIESCAYTKMPTTTLQLTTGLATSTYKDTCEVCTLDNANEQHCTSLSNCTPKTTQAPQPTERCITAHVMQTNCATDWVNDLMGIEVWDNGVRTCHGTTSHTLASAETTWPGTCNPGFNANVTGQGQTLRYTASDGYTIQLEAYDMHTVLQTCGSVGKAEIKGKEWEFVFDNGHCQNCDVAKLCDWTFYCPHFKGECH